MLVTVEQLELIVKYAPAKRVKLHIGALNAAGAEAEINTPLRWAMFLAQVLHECCEFRYLEEIWGPTPAQLRYEPPSDLAKRLGNTETGDGLRFKGRGTLQLTGRANYRAAGEDLELPLEEVPAIAAEISPAHRIAGWYWKKHGLNKPSDAGDLERATKLVNGGLNGIDAREEYYDRACDVLGA